MKSLKKFGFKFLVLVIITSVSQCSSAQKVQKKTPIKLNEVYFQKWVAGVEGGGSGINIFITEDLPHETAIRLDSVYFRGKVAKLEVKYGKALTYIGRFKSTFNQKKDIILSNEPYAEYGNQLPDLPEKLPFEINDTECIVSYKEGNTTKYFKIENIQEKEMISYPSAPPKKQ